MTLKPTSGGVNPIIRMLFMGMTMKAWIKYSKNVVVRMKAAQDNGLEYVPSESDEGDYVVVDSEYSQSDLEVESDLTEDDEIREEDEEDQKDSDEFDKEKSNEQLDSGINDARDQKPQERSSKYDLDEEKESFFNQKEEGRKKLNFKHKQTKRVLTKSGTRLSISSNLSKRDSQLGLGESKSLSKLSLQKIPNTFEENALYPKILYNFVNHEESPDLNSGRIKSENNYQMALTLSKIPDVKKSTPEENYGNKDLLE